MPDSNSFTRSDALGYDLFAASRLRRAVDQIFANAVSCERALALKLQQFFFTQADPVDDVNLFTIRLDFARESDSGLGQFG